MPITADQRSAAEPAAAVVTITDETLEWRNRDAVTERARTGLAASGARSLVLDLEAVRFIDSAGVGALVMLNNDARRLGGTVAVRSARPRVRRVLDVLDLSGVLLDAG